MMDILLVIFLIYCFIKWAKYNSKEERNIKYRNNAYKESEYFKITGLPFSELMNNKGLRGEYYVYLNLKEVKEPRRFLFNCYLPNKNGSTTELDVILINPGGIFVFENKNYSGLVEGKESSKYLLHTTKDKTYSFENPIRQNNGHIQALKSYLKEFDVPIYSICSFSDYTELKIESDPSSYNHIWKLGELKNNIDKMTDEFLRYSSRALNSEIIESIYNKLYPCTQVDEEIKKEHISRINRDYEKIKRCPRCGATLYVKTARKGIHAGTKFLGCDNYPDCKYTEPIDL